MYSITYTSDDLLPPNWAINLQATYGLLFMFLV